MKPTLAVAALSVLAAALFSQEATREIPGPSTDGRVLLSNGWLLKPAGKQVRLGPMPMSSLLSKDGRYLITLSSGYLQPSLTVLDVTTMREVSSTNVPDAWLGLTASPNGTLLYVSGGSKADILEFGFAGGRLTPARTFPIVTEAARKPEDFVGDVTMSPDGRLLYAAMLHRNEVAVVNPQSGMVIERWKTGRRPYRILFHPDGKSYFVTNWADGTVGHYDAANGQVLGSARLGPHPTDMVWRGKKTVLEEGQTVPWQSRLFVTVSNTNKVYVVGITEAKDLNLVETLNVAMTPRQPFGMTPSALALNTSETRLFIACSDANAVAVADVSGPAGLVLGFIPTGWYPVAVRTLPNDDLVVLNGRGDRSFANPGGPAPTRRAPRTPAEVASVQSIAALQVGSASFVQKFDEERLEAYTKAVIGNTPYKDNLLDSVSIPAGNPVLPGLDRPSPIEHIIYIVKESRSYDQVLGDLGNGNARGPEALFGERYTPNHHKLAREFVLLDNFHATGDTNIDGLHWSTAAIANDYVQKLWPATYAGRRKIEDFEGQDIAAYPPAGFLWSNALSAGLTVRNYGWWVTNLPDAAAYGSQQVKAVRDPVLRPVTAMNYRGFDLDYPDTDRAQALLDDLKQFDVAGTLPRLSMVRLGNDRTAGLAAGKRTPAAHMADNDYALGMIVEAVSRGKYWAKTAIFVVESSAEDGGDHVDGHRSLAFVLSPYTRRSAVDSTMYTTSSVLRTMELILGLRPMTHFDASARPMWAAFANTPNLAPYTAEKPRVSTTDRNPQESASVPLKGSHALTQN